MRRQSGLVVVAVVALAGCQSPYHADQGALFGGLTGAGVGAVVGNAVGNTGAGAAIGAGVGALTGAAVGESLDEIEARNRAQIAATLGQQVRAGAVTIDDVVKMTKAGVSEQLIVTHVHYHGVAQPLTSNDLIYLKQQGVADSVIEAMQQPPAPQVATAVAPAPVVVQEHYYGPPPPYYYYGRPYWHGHYGAWGRRPRTSIGFSISR